MSQNLSLVETGSVISKISTINTATKNTRYKSGWNGKIKNRAWSANGVQAQPDGALEGIWTPGFVLRSLAWPVTYGPNVTSYYFSFKIYLWVQGFCDENCTKGRIMTRFLRRPISKFLARISLDAVRLFSLQALLTEQIMEVKQWKIMKSVRCRKRALTP